MWRSRAWGVGWLAVGVMAAAACSSRSEGVDSTFVVAVETPTTVPVESSTTSVPSTTAVATSAASTTTEAAVDGEPLLPDPVDDAPALTHPDAPPPPVDLQADTWAELVGVWSDIDAYWTWLNAHPTDDAEVLSVIFDPEGPEYAEQQDVFNTLLTRDWRIIAPSTLGEVIGFGCCPDPAAELATGRMRLLIETRSRDGEAVVVSAGDRIEQAFDGWERRSFEVDLVRSGEGDWHVWLLE